jgi:homeobox-leucine zipper protein
MHAWLSGAVITQEGKRSMLKLARRMTENFCAGVSASSAREWSKLDGAAGSIGEDVRVMARKSVDEPGEPPGVVLSAATSVWVPVAPEKLFNFLRDEQLRAEWDILSNGGPMQEMANIAKGQEHGNSVSLLRASVSTTAAAILFCFFFSNSMSRAVPPGTCHVPCPGNMVQYHVPRP